MENTSGASPNIPKTTAASAAISQPAVIRLRQAAARELPAAPAARSAAARSHDGARRRGGAGREIQQAAAGSSTYLKFVVNPENHQLSIQIRDARSNEVVRTIPPEEMVNFVGRELSAVGTLLDFQV